MRSRSRLASASTRRRCSGEVSPRSPSDARRTISACICVSTCIHTLPRASWMFCDCVRCRSLDTWSECVDCMYIGWHCEKRCTYRALGQFTNQSRWHDAGRAGTKLQARIDLGIDCISGSIRTLVDILATGAGASCKMNMDVGWVSEFHTYKDRVAAPETKRSMRASHDRRSSLWPPLHFYNAIPKRPAHAATGSMPVR